MYLHSRPYSTAYHFHEAMVSSYETLSVASTTTFTRRQFESLIGDEPLDNVPLGPPQLNVSHYHI